MNVQEALSLIQRVQVITIRLEIVTHVAVWRAYNACILYVSEVLSILPDEQSRAARARNRWPARGHGAGQTERPANRIEGPANRISCRTAGAATAVEE